MQIKLTWYYNNAKGRHEEEEDHLARRAYHGVTIATASLTGLPWVHTDFDLPIAGILHTSCPHYYRFGQDGESEEQFSDALAQELEDMILERRSRHESPPSSPSRSWAPAASSCRPRAISPEDQGVLAKYDIRFIADEVICGFGRTGNWFGTETFSSIRIRCPWPRP